MTQALEEVRAWTGETRAGADSDESFSAIQAVLRDVGEPLHTLEETVRLLAILRFTTRIESAWLGDQAADFGSLAEEMRSLGEGIEAKSQALAEAQLDVSALLDHARQTVSQEEGRHRSEILGLTAECAESQEEVRREHESITQTSAAARQDYERVAADTSDLVLALQAHDSVRQRLEHVVESLRRVQERIASGTADAASVSQIVSLQGAQLGQARKALLEAVGNVRASLARIGQIVGARQHDETMRDAADGMAAHLLAMATGMEELAASRRMLAGTGEQVRRACVRMTAFVEEIEALGARLMRLGLNAEVQAVRLEHCGAVMESVASNIRRIARMSSEGAHKAGGLLRGLAPLAEKLAASLGEGGAGARNPIEISGQLRTTSAALLADHDEDGKLLASIATAADSLARQIEALLASITADRITERTVGSCLEVLDRVVRDVKRRAPRVSQRADTRFVEQSSAIYTMDAEREAHQAFTTGISGEESILVAAGKAGGMGDGDMGENVELF